MPRYDTRAGPAATPGPSACRPDGAQHGLGHAALAAFVGVHPGRPVPPGPAVRAARVGRGSVGRPCRSRRAPRTAPWAAGGGAAPPPSAPLPAVTAAASATHDATAASPNPVRVLIPRSCLLLGRRPARGASRGGAAPVSGTASGSPGAARPVVVRLWAIAGLTTPYARPCRRTAVAAAATAVSADRTRSGATTPGRHALRREPCRAQARTGDAFGIVTVVCRRCVRTLDVRRMTA